jgi:hypothetical protein
MQGYGLAGGPRAPGPVFGSREEFLAGFPDREASLRDSDKHAWSMLPLVSTAQVIGAMLVSYTAPRVFTRDDREAQTVLSGLCARALERALL